MHLFYSRRNVTVECSLAMWRRGRHASAKLSSRDQLLSAISHPSHHSFRKSSPRGSPSFMTSSPTVTDFSMCTMMLSWIWLWTKLKIALNLREYAARGSNGIECKQILKSHVMYYYWMFLDICTIYFILNLNYNIKITLWAKKYYIIGTFLSCNLLNFVYYFLFRIILISYLLS